jgi:hypothetical protein
MVKKLKQPETTKKRPALLSALCILTFIGSSIGFAGYFMASLLFEKSAAFIVKYSSWHTTEAITPAYFTLLMALFALSLTGAIRMWKFHRDGFYLYVFAQLAILFVPVIWLDLEAFSYTNAIFTVIFIAGYGLNLKVLR